MAQCRDNRNWRTYNQHLVQRGEILLRFEVLQDWRRQVARMNRGKRGRPFLYPTLLMVLYGMMRAAFHLPYRQLEGLARALGRLTQIPAPDYSTFSLRLPQLKLALQPELNSQQPVILAIDSSGVKLIQKGQWSPQALQRKGWVKIHVAIDVKSKQVIAVRFSPGTRHDGGYLFDLLRAAERRAKIKRVLADSGYDSSRNHALLRKRGIESGIKPKSNSGFAWYHKPPRTARAAVVRKWFPDPEKWKREVGYGQRQTVESFFSAFKRMFGESVQNRRWQNIVEELYLKLFLYNLWQGLEGPPTTA